MNKGIIYAVILTAALGRIQFQGHTETWYNLPMDKVIKKGVESGIVQNDPWVRADGCRMISHYVIVAADYNVHPYGSIVMTSRGEGIVLDTGEFTKTDPTAIDIATTWNKGGKK